MLIFTVEPLFATRTHTHTHNIEQLHSVLASIDDKFINIIYSALVMCYTRRILNAMNVIVVVLISQLMVME